MKQIIYNRCFFVAVWMILVASCAKKEEALTPTDGPEIGFEWPQSNNDYDQRIAGYYDKYGCFLLYKFSDKDAYWSIRTWDTSYKLKPADPLYIHQQLDLLDTTFSGTMPILLYGNTFQPGCCFVVASQQMALLHSIRLSRIVILPDLVMVVMYMEISR
ncbi:hypothetical protein [Niabella hibiscisoli]|uniref:hypothetical protein n=1 Tax=Niabella hibiscisoli TaxID=1825928 RepID=UPI001F0F468B|nr:hypothetical protein [Niabella hibiscisoli]MCH5721103.1 hypothetical protein [Niabella hibiscisoli]